MIAKLHNECRRCDHYRGGSGDHCGHDGAELLRRLTDAAVGRDWCPLGRWPESLRPTVRIPREAVRADAASSAATAAVRPSPVAAPTSAIASERMLTCRRCDAYNGAVCERQFHCGACLGTWLRWLADPASRCPLGLWP